MAPVNQPVTVSPSVANLSSPLTSPAKSGSLPIATPLSPASNPFPPFRVGFQNSSSGPDAAFLANARAADSLVTRSPVVTKAPSLIGRFGVCVLPGDLLVWLVCWPTSLTHCRVGDSPGLAWSCCFNSLD